MIGSDSFYRVDVGVCDIVDCTVVVVVQIVIDNTHSKMLVMSYWLLVCWQNERENLQSVGSYRMIFPNKPIVYF